MIRLLAPKGSLEIHEEAWNAYPYCRTVITVRLFFYLWLCSLNDVVGEIDAHALNPTDSWIQPIRLKSVCETLMN